MAVEGGGRKRADNLAKHGVDFVRAARMFDNPVLERIDDREDYGEERIIALGHAVGFYVVAVYTWGGANRRLISAWRAGRDEIQIYQDALSERH